MIEFLYTKMKSKSKEMLGDDEKVLLERKELEEIIEYLRKKSSIYDIFASRYGIYYDKEDLASIMCKGKFIFSLLEIERYAKLLDNKKAEKLVASYLIPHKVKILSLFITALYAHKDFDDIKNALVFSPEMVELFEKYYNEIHIYDLSLHLLGDKKISQTIQSEYSKGNLQNIWKILLNYEIEQLIQIYEMFGRKGFIALYIYKRMQDIKAKCVKIGKNIEELYTGKKRKVLKSLLKKPNISNEEITHKAHHFFSYYPFTYDAFLAYLLLLEKDFRDTNRLIKIHEYRIKEKE